MNIRRLLSALMVALGLVLGLLWLLGDDPATGARAAAGLQVCPSGCAFASIQEAVDAATPGEVIQVAQGTYTDVHTVPSLSTPGFTATQIVAITKSLTLRGGYNDDFTAWDPETYHTVLDAQGQGRGVVVVGSGINPTVEGLHVTGGDSSGLGGSVYNYDGGGGIYILYGSAVISGNQVYNNVAYRGGGVWLQDCTATFRANTVRANAATWAGGGMWLYRSPSTLQGNTILSNTATYGSGMVLHLSDAALSSNTIISNTATDSEGGGITLLSSKATLDGNLILANRVDEAGGGLYLSASDATLTNNVIADNHANRLGSGLYIQGSYPRLIHNTIARNGGWGGGLYAATSTWGDVSYVAMTNTIVFSHTEGIIAADGNTVTLHSTLWYANLTDWIGPGAVQHNGDIFGDPAFGADGYHLTAGSAAIDRGADASVATDIDGDPRPIGRPDIGVDEWGTRVYLPLTLR